MPRALCRIQAVYRTEVSRCPEKEKPPHPVGHKLARGESPRLPVFECLRERHLFARYRYLFGREQFSIGQVVLLDISQFGGIYPWVLVWLLIHEYPKTHPNEPQSADNNK